MARPFSSSEAKELIDKHFTLIDQLEASIRLTETYKDNIRKAVNSLVIQESLKVLRNVPVEELNSDKRGIRTKTLRDYNYNTIADFYAASIHNIASIRGISQDAAYTIKRLADDFIMKTQREVKIKLSADNKTKEASKLINDIYIYKKSVQNIEKCRELQFRNNEIIEDSIDEVSPSTNALKWFFTSKSKKKKAVEAYQKLSDLLNGEYGNEVREELFLIEKVTRTPLIDVWNDFIKDSIAYISIIEEINPDLLGNDDSVYGLPEDLAREIQDECLFPEGLLCKLRDYQEWGVKYILHQEKVLLGDEMGLGKTIQAIATMVSLKNTGATHFVVVCPASVSINWCREITKHSLLRVTKVHGNGRKAALNSWVRTGGVAVTTYETTGHFNLDEHFTYSLLVVDEAHYIKNPDAIRTINTTKLKGHADRLLFMTGTALENRVDEMITLIDMLQPHIVNQVKNIAFMSSAPLFREKIAPVYYRRKREDVLTELPDLIESKEWCSMTFQEEQIYENAILSKRFAEARRVSWNIEDLNKSTKAKRLKEIVEEAELDNRKIIVFSFFLDTIHKIPLFLENRCLNPITGSVSPERRQEIIDEFDQSPPGTVLVAQIQSGGTGLNIQAASVVVICEPQFKPSIENQAISRAYRMGQSRNVMVHRLLCENTIDEKITGMLEEKQAIFDAFADKSVAAESSLEIDDKSFGSLIKEEIDRINAKHSGVTLQN